MSKKLPIGYSDLEKIISQDYVYVDKTHHVVNLISSGGYYFLSRPRRFGKSLLVDTLKQAFLGRQDLFTGLYLGQHWDFSRKYPVIHLDFSEGVLENRQQLEAKIHKLLDIYYAQHQVESHYQDISSRFSELIDALAAKYHERVVILIDEYDKPILDNITNEAAATENREGLKNLYSVIKGKDAKLKFVLLTGVTKFSKVSLFSGLNNLRDITLDAEYADICGYTQAELEYAFSGYLSGIDKEELKRWYNGYNFTGSETQKVYNPFDILLFFANKGVYRGYWFETGSPSFLLKLLQSKRYYLPDVENLVVGPEILDSFDVSRIGVESLLFQTGYLTIAKVNTNPFNQQINYTITYPNLEVRVGLMANLLEYLLADNVASISSTNQRLTNILSSRDFAAMEGILKQFFASIPYNWYVKNDIANYEGFYAVVVYSLFNGLGVIAIPEDTTNRGRIDLTIHTPEYIILLEFKLSTLGDAKSAIKQLTDKNYAAKYQAENKPIYLIGISFDIESRNISSCAIAEIGVSA